MLSVWKSLKFVIWERVYFADGNSDLTRMLQVFFDRVETFVGKQENAVYQHFLLFPQCFQKASLPGLFIVWLMSRKGLRLKKVLKLEMGTSNRLIEYSIECLIIE